MLKEVRVRKWNARYRRLLGYYSKFIGKKPTKAEKRDIIGYRVTLIVDVKSNLQFWNVNDSNHNQRNGLKSLEINWIWIYYSQPEPFASFTDTSLPWFHPSSHSPAPYDQPSLFQLVPDHKFPAELMASEEWMRYWFGIHLWMQSVFWNFQDKKCARIISHSRG